MFFRNMLSKCHKVIYILLSVIDVLTEYVWTFHLELQFTTKKVIKAKGDKLYVKWKVCDNSLNNQIDNPNIL